MILDEIHHAGRRARRGATRSRRRSTPAARRLTLTGTPVPQRRQPDPVRRLPARTPTARCAAAPTTPTATPRRWPTASCGRWCSWPTPGTSSWRTSAGEEITARLGEPMTAEQTARAWRTALDPAGEWIPAVLAAADRRLTGHRAGGMPDAGGLVIASDQTTARAYAAILTDVTGTAPVVVLSDEPGRLGADRAVRRVRRPLDGRGPDGVRGRRRAAPGRRRVRHQRVDPAVLRPGRRPVRAVAAAGGDRVGVRAERAGAAGAGQRAGGPARPRARQAAPGRRAVGRRAARRAPSARRTSRGRTRSRSPRSARRPSWTS